MLGKLIKREEVSPIQDFLIVFSTNGTADFVPVVEVNEERILASGEVDYSIPLADAKAYIGRRGRIFSYPATEENITDTKRLAALERSTVLKQITIFEKERFTPDGKLPLGKMMLIGAIVLVVIIIMVVKH
jgi:hypothetical protein